MTACGMSTHIVQIAYKKCLEMHDFVPIFLQIILVEEPRPLPLFT